MLAQDDSASILLADRDICCATHWSGRIMSAFTKTYTNGDITIVWNAELCEHSGNCFRNLPQVFDLRVNPWIRMDNADSQTIVNVVQRCPSGALTIQNKSGNGNAQD